ncbi:tripartite tricarboxylate transporter TctB family protein [Sediminispirochaeta smaragdinae]
MESTGNPLVGPGVFPSILSTIILICSVLWCIDSLVAYLKHQKSTGTQEAHDSPNGLFHFTKESRRLAIIIILTVLYILILMPLVGFVISTFLFLFVSVMLFYGKLSSALIVSVLLSLVMFVLFQFVLHLPMPR